MDVHHVLIFSLYVMGKYDNKVYLLILRIISACVGTCFSVTCACLFAECILERRRKRREEGMERELVGMWPKPPPAYPSPYAIINLEEDNDDDGEEDVPVIDLPDPIEYEYDLDPDAFDEETKDKETKV